MPSSKIQPSWAPEPEIGSGKIGATKGKQKLLWISADSSWISIWMYKISDKIANSDFDDFVYLKILKIVWIHVNTAQSDSFCWIFNAAAASSWIPWAPAVDSGALSPCWQNCWWKPKVLLILNSEKRKSGRSQWIYLAARVSFEIRPSQIRNYIIEQLVLCFELLRCFIITMCLCAAFNSESPSTRGNKPVASLPCWCISSNAFNR